MADFDVTIGADLSEILTELRQVSNVSDKEFKKLTKGVEKSFRGARSEARRLRNAMRKDVQKQGKAAFESVKQAAEGLGGTVGGAAGMVEKFGRSITEAGSAVGPLGAAAAAVVVSVTGLGFAVSQLVRAQAMAISTTIEWARELDELGQNRIPEATAAAIEFGDSLKAGQIVGKELTVLFGGEFLGTLQESADTLLAYAVAARRVWVELDVLRDSISAGLAPGALLLKQTGALNTAVTGLSLAFPGLREEVALLKAGYREGEMQIDSSKRSMSDMLGLTEAIKNAREAGNRLLREEAAALRAQGRAVQELTDGPWNDWVAGLERANDRAQEQIKTTQDMNAAMAQAAEKAADATWRAWEQSNEKQRRNDERMLEDKRKTQVAVLDLQSSMFQSITMFSDMATDNIRENDKLTAKQQQQRIATAFRVGQVAAVGQVAVDAASAIMGMTAALSFMGPAAVPVAVGSVVPVAAAQTAAILSQKPPTFPMGGMVGDQVDADHVMIGAQREEAVLTRRGVAAAGGPAGVDAMNSGRAGGPIEVHVHLPGGVVARAVVSDRQTRKAIVRVAREDLRIKG